MVVLKQGISNDRMHWLGKVHWRRWGELKSIVRIELIRAPGDQVEQETNYYISSLSETRARFLEIIPGSKTLCIG